MGCCRRDLGKIEMGCPPLLLDLDRGREMLPSSCLGWGRRSHCRDGVLAGHEGDGLRLRRIRDQLVVTDLLDGLDRPDGASPLVVSPAIRCG
ncbi:hypothetical protein ACLOJK_040234 [Asimina triloba]